ncbi:MAG: response regulator transcription factor [Solirubrobacteraceae bacterium]
MVAERDARLRGFLAAQLVADGAEVHVAEDVAGARARAAAHCPDVMVLGGLEGPAATMQLLRHLRVGDGSVRGLRVLVVLDEEHDLVVLRAFDAGADDVVGRAVSYPVLRARVRALLGRGHAAESVRRVGVLEVRPASREVRLRGSLVELSAKEFALLSALVAEPTRVFAKQELLREVWAFRSAGRTRTLDSHACRLRAKLAAVGGDRFVVNVWGVGYRLADPTTVAAERAA